ncbi:putative Proteasome-associated ATPase [Verrucomicrobia bacterium]|nr:putative Proteasome-associated ATPase [Verrucomicrobiota bacterium]
MKNSVPPEINELLRALLSASGELNIDQVTANVQQLRTMFPEHASQIDRVLVELLANHRRGLQFAQRQIRECQKLLEQLSAPPLHPAVFLRTLSPGDSAKALVQTGNSRRAVVAGEGVDLSKLARGDEVFLNHEQNLILCASPEGPPRGGETATFERKLPDNRLLLRWHDDLLVVESAAALDRVTFKLGDGVRFDRNAWMAFEKIVLETARRYLLDEAPNVSLAAVGGQGANLESLLSALTVILVEPERAAAYGLTGRNSILMCGPPGCGKTLMARAAAAEIARLSGKKAHFAVVKPGELISPFVGESERQIREFFQMLREASEDGFAVAFMDEIESIGRIRGGTVSQHADKFLASFLAELDGFVDRRNVAIICATNRKDLLDSALYERLTNLEIYVGRPDLRAARAIFQIHLPETVPFHPNGELAKATRDELVELAVSRLYSPNADNELCRLKFRDGNQRTIAARELASGRLFENICRTARRSAFLREVRGGEPGVRLADMEDAVGQTLERMRTTLTVHNAHAYLNDLPQDVDVVGVEPAVRKVKQHHQYFNPSN